MTKKREHPPHHKVIFAGQWTEEELDDRAAAMIQHIEEAKEKSPWVWSDVKQPHLRDWCIRKYLRNYGAEGIVNDSPKFRNGERINTSRVQYIKFDAKTNECYVHTKNTMYICSVSTCDFTLQQKIDIIPVAAMQQIEAKQKQQLPEENYMLIECDKNEPVYMRVRHVNNITGTQIIPAYGFSGDNVLFFDESRPANYDIRHRTEGDPLKISFYALSTTIATHIKIINKNTEPIIIEYNGRKTLLQPGEYFIKKGCP